MLLWPQEESNSPGVKGSGLVSDWAEERGAERSNKKRQIHTTATPRSESAGAMKRPVTEQSRATAVTPKGWREVCVCVCVRITSRLLSVGARSS